ncbi:MAG TPA: metal-dependent hydrolase [Gemmataceae bacterium]|nr:metal-dependent hydrolase [Gemmataceae bacterium]
MPPANFSISQPKISASVIVLWIGTGAAASLSHLVADIFYSGHRGGDVWPLRLLWPFSDRGWAFPIIDWGDLGATIILVAEMFALYRWPALAQRIAWAGLAAVCLYVGTRWLLSVS